MCVALAQAELTAELLAREVHRRRNFAIISHPDAGKVSLCVRLGERLPLVFARCPLLLQPLVGPLAFNPLPEAGTRPLLVAGLMPHSWCSRAADNDDGKAAAIRRRHPAGRRSQSAQGVQVCNLRLVGGRAVGPKTFFSSRHLHRLHLPTQQQRKQVNTHAQAHAIWLACSHESNCFL